MAEKTNSYCNQCTGFRWHEVLHVEKTSWHDDIYEYGRIEGDDVYEMLKCCGCEQISMRHESRFSEERDRKGEPLIKTFYYPPAIFRQKPKWIGQFEIWGGFISELIQEIYVAIQNDSRRLAAMGVRALLETVMIEKIGDNGTFNENLNQFYKQGYISKIQKDALEPILEAGHATIHRNFAPSSKDMQILVDIAESIIEAVYVNEEKAKHIQKNIPPRKTKRA